MLNFPDTEKKILKFWEDKKVFEKSVDKNKKNFVFYEGPPTANGRPGIHHVLARAYKDIVCRYKTMQGFRVERKAGWDTHGLPVELEVEKKLGIKSKKEVEDYGVDKFNQECKKSVWEYKKEWEDLTKRIGYWVDLENPYITYDNEYIESVWAILKKIWEKELLYQGYKVAPYCPRCETVLSSHEVSQGYKKIKEPAIFVRLKIKNPEYKDTYLLVWTTTPWTLPANVAVAVNPDFTYVQVKDGKEYLIIAQKRSVFLDIDLKRSKEIKGEDLVGLEYEPLYPNNIKDENIYKVVAADFVSLEEGSGLVHMAPAFGEDDSNIAKKEGLPTILNVDYSGKFNKEVKKWAGLFVKDADPLIIKDLESRGLIFKEEMYDHDYPFCWRCKSPLLYYAKKSWFINMQEVKKDLIKNNDKINWIPKHLKEGRFGEWVREVKDWALSRERFWGTPLPIWKCDTCDQELCIGSIEELKEKSGKEIKDLHRPFVDNITITCKCKGTMRRVPEVIDCWFDSGSMPFAQRHWPFSQRSDRKPPEMFPAEYISEAVDQTRGWFYTMLAISTLLDFGPSYKNAISVGHILDEKGEKMSKSKGNIVNPWDVIDKYGADSTRWYFYTVNQPGESKTFIEKDLDSVFKRFILTLWNNFIFFNTYKDKLVFEDKTFKSKNILDQWILSKFNNLLLETTEGLDRYNITSSMRSIEKFVVEDLSQWYIRRSRRRFQKPKDKEEKEEAAKTLYFILLNLSKLMAPAMPFISEHLYQELKNEKMPESVHLCDWPKIEKKYIDKKLEDKMIALRTLITQVLAQRKEAGIKVRQPLAKVIVKVAELKKEEELLGLAKEEINVKEIIFDKNIKKDIELDLNLTSELKEEGLLREVLRQIQVMRKKAGYKPMHRVRINYSGTKELNEILAKKKEYIIKEAKAESFELGDSSKEIFDEEKTLNVNDQELWLAIKRL
jgi:isoleucyl-tRNA synthetase